MRIRTSLYTVLTGLVLAVAAAGAHAQAREEGRLLTASQVLEELRATRDQAIPDRLLERAYGIAVIPDMTKIAFFAGGNRGHGVLVVRDKDGRFTSPVFVTMTGGSFGWQWGVQFTDIVLVFTSRRGIEGITGGKVTLGADASVAAGPVGRQASAATDAGFKAEVYSYSRSRGVFAGIALDGTAITIDDKADAEFYKKPGLLASDIISGTVTTEDEASRRFLAAVSASTRGQQSTSVASSAPAPGKSPTPAAAASTTPPGSPPKGAQSFPMEDPQPGHEPK
jgi:lipid-binding SYLF domain-containing protein